MIFDDLTIIIPSYNCGHYLPQTLDSILKQSVQPKAIIVIDDCTTDNSNEIVREYQKQHSHVELTSNPRNIGVNATTNRGLEVATTKYLMSLAADDWLMPGFIEQAMQLLQQYPDAGLCSTGSLIAIESKNNLLKPAEMPRPLKSPGYISQQQAIEFMIKYGSWFMGNTVIYNRERAISFGGYRESLHSFADNFMYRQLSAKYGCCFIPQNLGVWRLRDKSYSQTTYKSTASLAQIMHTYIELMQHEGPKLFPNNLIKREAKRWAFEVIRSLFNNTSRFGKCIFLPVIYAYLRPFDLVNKFKIKFESL